MKNRPFDKNISYLSLRNAFVALPVISILSFMLITLFLPASLLPTIITAVLIGIFSSVAVYTITYNNQNERLQTLDRIYKNIAAKRFHDYEKLKKNKKDELDYLISESIKASRTVEREIQRLNRIENYRKEFIGDISHELKTPIFAIQGFIETLLNGAIDDEEVNRNFLKKAMRNVNRLIYLTKDLMDISKLETGELKSEVQNISIKNIITEVVESLQYKAEEDDIDLQIEAIPDSLMVMADRNQIKQVLANLIENAIKYNKPGGNVRIGTEKYKDDPSRILIYVKDTGIGISQQFIDRVTERFFRVDKSRSREKGGTGLGLAIVKHIMEAHDEEFFIESKPNVGSRFSFTLKKAKQPTAKS